MCFCPLALTFEREDESCSSWSHPARRVWLQPVSVKQHRTLGAAYELQHVAGHPLAAGGDGQAQEVDALIVHQALKHLVKLTGHLKGGCQAGRGGGSRAELGL